MNKYIKRARQMRSQLNNITKDFTDEQAFQNKDLYPDWNGNGVLLWVGDIVYYKESIYKVLQSHTTQLDWAPDVAVSLFVKISIEEIPEWEKPDSTNPYMLGDKVRFEGHIYESTMDYNIWSPSEYPAGWRMIE